MEELYQSQTETQNLSQSSLPEVRPGEGAAFDWLVLETRRSRKNPTEDLLWVIAKSRDGERRSGYFALQDNCWGFEGASEEGMRFACRQGVGDILRLKYGDDVITLKIDYPAGSLVRIEEVPFENTLTLFGDVEVRASVTRIDEQRNAVRLRFTNGGREKNIFMGVTRDVSDWEGGTHCSPNWPLNRYNNEGLGEGSAREVFLETLAPSMVAEVICTNWRHEMGVDENLWDEPLDVPFREGERPTEERLFMRIDLIGRKLLECAGA